MACMEGTNEVPDFSSKPNSIAEVHGQGQRIY